MRARRKASRKASRKAIRREILTTIIYATKFVWLWMILAPWKDQSDENWPLHWIFWLINWAWVLAGLTLGALIAPALVQRVGLASTPYLDWLVIGVALLAGFLLQVVGMFVLGIVYLGINIALVTQGTAVARRADEEAATIVVAALFLTAFGIFAGVGYAVYRYFTWVGPGQHSATIAFVGALLVKTFLIPFIKGIVTGALFKWFMNWLRDGKDRKKA